MFAPNLEQCRRGWLVTICHRIFRQHRTLWHFWSRFAPGFSDSIGLRGTCGHDFPQDFPTASHFVGRLVTICPRIFFESAIEGSLCHFCLTNERTNERRTSHPSQCAPFGKPLLTDYATASHTDKLSCLRVNCSFNRTTVKWNSGPLM